MVAAASINVGVASSSSSPSCGDVLHRRHLEPSTAAMKRGGGGGGGGGENGIAAAALKEERDAAAAAEAAVGYVCFQLVEGLGFSSVVIDLLFDFPTCPNYQKLSQIITNLWSIAIYLRS